MYVPIDKVLAASHIARVIRKEEQSLARNLMGLGGANFSVTKQVKKHDGGTYLCEAAQRQRTGLVIADLLVHVLRLIRDSCRRLNNSEYAGGRTEDAL